MNILYTSSDDSNTSLLSFDLSEESSYSETLTPYCQDLPLWNFSSIGGTKLRAFFSKTLDEVVM